MDKMNSFSRDVPDIEPSPQASTTQQVSPVVKVSGPKKMAFLPLILIMALGVGGVYLFTIGSKTATSTSKLGGGSGIGGAIGNVIAGIGSHVGSLYSTLGIGVLAVAGVGLLVYLMISLRK